MRHRAYEVERERVRALLERRERERLADEEAARLARLAALGCTVVKPAPPRRAS